jgi:peptidoglycan/LPS O-acetylase OafA/YrhL
MMRAVAACLVVYLHGNSMLELVSPTLACLPIMDGVDLFFALSGFLIGGIILRQINSGEKLDLSFVKKFLIRRWFRTLPNYYLFLLLNITLIYCGLVKDGILNKYLGTYFVFFQNFYKPFDFLFWESWSLSVEEWFYFAFPIALIIGILLIKNRKVLFISCAILFILFSTLVRFYKAPIGNFAFENWDVLIRKIVICRLDSIGFGLLAAWFCFYYYSTWKKMAIPLFIFGLGIYVLILQMGIDRNHYFSTTWHFTFTGLASALLLPWAEQTKRYSGSFGKFVTFLSVISYAMYLCNRGVVAALITHNFNYSAHPLLYYLLYWALVIGLSALVYNFFERPLTNLRERFK